MLNLSPLMSIAQHIYSNKASLIETESSESNHSTKIILETQNLKIRTQLIEMDSEFGITESSNE